MCLLYSMVSCRKAGPWLSCSPLHCRAQHSAELTSPRKYLLQELINVGVDLEESRQPAGRTAWRLLPSPNRRWQRCPPWSGRERRLACGPAPGSQTLWAGNKGRRPILSEQRNIAVGMHTERQQASDSEGSWSFRHPICHRGSGGEQHRGRNLFRWVVCSTKRTVSVREMFAWAPGAAVKWHKKRWN